MGPLIDKVVSCRISHYQLVIVHALVVNSLNIRILSSHEGQYSLLDILTVYSQEPHEINGRATAHAQNNSRVHTRISTRILFNPDSNPPLEVG